MAPSLGRPAIIKALPSRRAFFIWSNSMSKKHPGFKKVAAGIAKKQGISTKEADAELAASSRNASAKAKRANPNLKRVKG